MIGGAVRPHIYEQLKVDLGIADEVGSRPGIFGQPGLQPGKAVCFHVAAEIVVNQIAKFAGTIVCNPVFHPIISGWVSLLSVRWMHS